METRSIDVAIARIRRKIEDDQRYVTENRLRKMLKHETNLIEKRIQRKNKPNVRCCLLGILFRKHRSQLSLLLNLKCPIVLMLSR